MDVSDFEHGGGEFFDGPVGSKRADVKAFEVAEQIKKEELKDVLLAKEQELWLSIDNPYLWEPF